MKTTIPLKLLAGLLIVIVLLLVIAGYGKKLSSSAMTEEVALLRVEIEALREEVANLRREAAESQNDPAASAYDSSEAIVPQDFSTMQQLVVKLQKELVAALTNVAAVQLQETVNRGSDAWKRMDFAEALRLLLPAAQQGDPVAMHRLGVMNVFGQGVPQDLKQATEWFRKAAELGQGESQFSMGLRYLNGQTVEQDATAAAGWFYQAAQQGVRPAASVLAQLYASGTGVQQDLVEAYKWLVLARNQTEPNHVKISLGELMQLMTPEQIAEAQQRAQSFAPKRIAPGDF